VDPEVEALEAVDSEAALEAVDSVAVALEEAGRINGISQ